MKPFKRPDRKNYYIRENGRPVSLETDNWKWACQIADERQAKKLGVYHTPRRRVSTLIEPYLEYCGHYNKASTLDDKRRTMENFKTFAADPLIGRVSRKIVESYLNGRRGKVSGAEISADRHNTERQILNNFFNWLSGEFMLRPEANPVKQIQKKKIVKNRSKRVLTKVEEATLDRFLRAGEGVDLPPGAKNISEELRETLYIVKVVGIAAGMRAAELSHLTWPDIDFENRKVYVRAKAGWKPKDYEERGIPLKQATLTAIREFKLSRVIMGLYVFPRQDGKPYSSSGLVVSMCRAFRWAGIERGGLHTLRHTFATRYLQNGGTLKDLQGLLGHSDLKTTQGYAHEDEERQRAVVDRMD